MGPVKFTLCNFNMDTTGSGNKILLAYTLIAFVISRAFLTRIQF